MASLDRKRLRRAGIVAIVASSLLLGAWIIARAPADLLSAAVGPVGVQPEPAGADDAAGDVPASADAYMPLPKIFEDERVVAALGPLTRLSCDKDDPDSQDADPRRENAAQRSRALRAPLDPAVATDEIVNSAPLFSAAGAPIALLEGSSVEDTPTQIGGAGHECPALLQHNFSRLQTGETQSLCQFEGKVLLVVNTASYCAYTQQYEGLEAMYRKYRDRGLVVVGFPSNDFNQEPGSNKQIAEFCRTTYGVQFPMFEKSSVTSLAANPLFQELASATGTAPKWNFYKYVVDRQGRPIASFPSSVKPQDRRLTDVVERLLNERAASSKG